MVILTNSHNLLKIEVTNNVADVADINIKNAQANL